MSKKNAFPVRYRMVSGTFLLAMIVLFDRILISVAKDPVAQDLGLTDKEMGVVMSVFALGYAFFQTPAGYLADKLGARKVLTAVVSLWSIFTALTAAAWNYAIMVVIRFLFGMGEAGAFPSMARAIYSWVPLKERGLVNGINFSGGRIGAALALPVVAWLIELTSWRMTFVILGVIGVIWSLIWYWWFRDSPAEHPSMSSEELEYIENNIQVKEEKKEAISFGKMFGSKDMWLMMGQYFSSNFTFFFCLTWLFPFLKSKYNLDAVEAGFYSSAPLMAGALGNWVSGFTVDTIFKRGKWSLSRKVPAIIGFTLASVGILASIYMTEVTGAIIFISIAVFGADMTLSPSWSACVDLGKEHSGTVSGTMNMAGNIGSFFAAFIFPVMQSAFGTNDYFFFLAAGLNFLAIVLWLGVNPQKPMDLAK